MKMNREEQINAYLHHKLDPKGQEEVEVLYESDKEYKEEMDFQKDLMAAFASLEREQLKTKLQKFEEEIQNEEKTPNTTSKHEKVYKPWMLAAACILVIVGLGVMGLFNKSADPQAVYSDYFKPYENVVYPLVRGETKKNVESITFIAYEAENFEGTAKNFHTLFENTGKSYYLLYEANAYLAQGKPKKAIPLLQKQLSYEDEFAVKSKWYLALAYLKTREMEKAKQLFKEVKAKGGFKAHEAKEIMSKLE